MPNGTRDESQTTETLASNNRSRSPSRERSSPRQAPFEAEPTEDQPESAHISQVQTYLQVNKLSNIRVKQSRCLTQSAYLVLLDATANRLRDLLN